MVTFCILLQCNNVGLTGNEAKHFVHLALDSSFRQCRFQKSASIVTKLHILGRIACIARMWPIATDGMPRSRVCVCAYVCVGRWAHRPTLQKKAEPIRKGGQRNPALNAVYTSATWQIRWIDLCSGGDAACRFNYSSS